MYLTSPSSSHDAKNSWLVLTGTNILVPIIGGIAGFLLSSSVSATDKSLKNEETVNLLQTKLAIEEVAKTERIAREASFKAQTEALAKALAQGLKEGFAEFKKESEGKKKNQK